MANVLHISSKALYDHLEKDVPKVTLDRVATQDLMNIIAGVLDFLGVEEVEN